MALRDIPINFNLTTLSESAVRNELAGLNTNSAFQSEANQISGRIPDVLGGGTIQQFLITDNVNTWNQATGGVAIREVAPGVQVAGQGVIGTDGSTYVIYLNPNSAVPIGETIAHEFGHATDAGLQATAADVQARINGLSSSEGDKSENVARDFEQCFNQTFNPPLPLAPNQNRQPGEPPNYLYPQCFAAGTPILMADGTERPIEQIRPGDMVAAFAGTRNDGHAGWVPRAVARAFANVTDEWLILRAAESESRRFSTLTVTPGHYFLNANGAFRRIDQILAGDRHVVLADGSAIAVQAERIVYSRETAHLYERARIFQFESEGANAVAPQLSEGWKTYNFEVEELHTYIAGGVRVHNDSALSADPLDRSEPDGSVFPSVPPTGDPLDRFEPDGSVFQSVPPMGDPLDRFEPDGIVFQSTPPSNPSGGGGSNGNENGTTDGPSFVAADQRTDPLDRSEPDGSVFPSVPPMGDPLDRSEPDGSVFQSDQQQASPTSPDQLETYGTDASGIWISPGEAYASASPSGLNAAETATEIAGVSFNSAAEPPTGNVVMDTDTFTPNETNNEVFNDTGSGGFSNYGGSFYGGGSYGGGFYGGGSYGGGFYGGGSYGGGSYGGGFYGGGFYGGFNGGGFY